MVTLMSLIRPCSSADCAAVAVVTKPMSATGTTKPTKSVKAKAKGKSAKAKAKGKASEKAKMHQQLLKRPAKAPRPKWNNKPCHHHGGRIYWMGAKHVFRVYARKGDRVEKERVGVEPGNDKDKQEKFQISCAVIESDPRPVQ